MSFGFGLGLGQVRPIDPTDLKLYISKCKRNSRFSLFLFSRLFLLLPSRPAAKPLLRRAACGFSPLSLLLPPPKHLVESTRFRVRLCWLFKRGKAKMYNKKRANDDGKGGSLTLRSDLNMQEHNMDIRSIMKDIRKLGNSYMTWKEKKELENQKIVSLGGKAPKKQRLPLSVARVMMKSQKEREQKMQQQNLLAGLEGNFNRGTRRSTEKRKPEHVALKCSEGIFKNGVLDVKHLLRPTPSADNNAGKHMVSKGKNRKGGKKNKGKKKGARKRH